MIAAAWLMLGSLMYSLQLSPGSFPKPLTQKEEAHYLAWQRRGIWKPAIFSSNGICAWLPIL